jgi:hypothetical protein
MVQICFYDSAVGGVEVGDKQTMTSLINEAWKQAGLLKDVLTVRVHFAFSKMLPTSAPIYPSLPSYCYIFCGLRWPQLYGVGVRAQGRLLAHYDEAGRMVENLPIALPLMKISQTMARISGRALMLLMANSLQNKTKQNQTEIAGQCSCEFDHNHGIS